ncbi:lipopolysaccharide transport periplasmic protein LptA [Vibrio sp.]|nr:lipopolysaccharide transport periplasmic protein LptA [Vibrio sp.]
MKIASLSALTALVFTFQANALTTDSEQPIYIDSDSQQLDMKSNKVTFSGNVQLKQGSIEVYAEEIIVLRDPTDGSIQEIESYGDLATFTQVTDEGNRLYGEAKELYYNMAEEQLTMVDNAMLSQDDSKIKGPLIKYNIASQTLLADGAKNKKSGKSEGRVSTVLHPQAAQKDNKKPKDN